MSDSVSQKMPSYNRTQPVRVEIEQQGDLLKVRFPLPHYLSRPKEDAVTTKRGTVKEFSRKSRKRLMEKFARLDRDEIATMRNKPKFITLTYKENMRDAKRAKTHLDTFLKVLRRISEESSGVWRMEFQERGAIHLHLIIFNLRWTKALVLQKHWSRITGESDVNNSLDIKNIRSMNGVIWYASKYLAKVDDESDDESDDEKLPSQCDMTRSLIESFLGLSMLHISPQGRHWGVYNAKHLPLAPLVKFRRIVTRETLVEWRKRLPSDYASAWNPFTIFSPSSWEFMHRFWECHHANEHNDLIAMRQVNRGTSWRTRWKSIIWRRAVKRKFSLEEYLKFFLLGELKAYGETAAQQAMREINATLEYNPFVFDNKEHLTR